MRSLRDLRNYLRLDSSFDVVFRVLPDTSNRDHRAQALDIGSGGVKVFTDRSLKKGTQLELLFYVDGKKDKGSAVSALGSVVWSREVKIESQGLGRYEVGIHFEEISIEDRDRIFQYVYKRLATQERIRKLIRRAQL